MGNGHAVISLIQVFIDVDDHISKVLSALAVVGYAVLVCGVNGEIQWRTGGRKGCHLSFGSGFLCSRLPRPLASPWGIGGHGGFIVVAFVIIVVGGGGRGNGLGVVVHIVLLFTF